MRRSTARTLGSALVLLALAGCAGTRGGPDDAFNVAAATLPKTYPACANEIKAFVALTRLASQMKDNSEALRPALEALRDDVMDCVADSYPDPQAINAPGRAARHQSDPSHNRTPARPTP